MSAPFLNHPDGKLYWRYRLMRVYAWRRTIRKLFRGMSNDEDKGVQREVGTSFGKHQRLLKQSAFKHVFAKGKRHNSPLFLVLVSPTPPSENGDGGRSEDRAGRLGLAVSKKVSRLAVVRNRVKRYIREAFRQQPQDWVGLDVVIVARRASVDATSADVQQALKRIAQKIDQGRSSVDLRSIR